MRPWADSSESFEVVWFRCEDTAVLAPQPNRFTSCVWDDATVWPVARIGDVRAAPRTWGSSANALCYEGLHTCGSASAWANGGRHGVDPVITTDADGAAGCCGDRPWQMSGGLGLGGSVIWSPREQRSVGGLGLGGEAHQLGRTYRMVGGLGLGGAVRQTGPTVMVGGLGLGGEAHQLGRTYRMVGGLGLGGEAHQLGRTYRMVGGLGLGGLTGQAGGGWILVAIPVWPFFARIQGGGHFQVASGGLGLGGVAGQESDQVYVGEYRMMYNSSPPTKWLRCDGSTFSSVTYPALAALLGDNFGVHSGTNYYLPNTSGRVLVDAGSGPGLTTRAPGNIAGQETVLLTANESGLRQHNHAPLSLAGFLTSSSAPGTGVAVGAGVINAIPATTANAGPLSASNAHDNMQPWYCVGYLYIYAG